MFDMGAFPPTDRGWICQAVPNSEFGVGHVKAILKDLERQDFVRCIDDRIDSWQLSHHAMSSICHIMHLSMLAPLCQPRSELALKDMTKFELLHVMKEKGWLAKAVPDKAKRGAVMPHQLTDDPDRSLVLYMRPASVHRSYLLALLSEDQLRALGVQEIVHFEDGAYYTHLLKTGRTDVKRRRLALEDDAEITPALVAIADAAAPALGDLEDGDADGKEDLAFCCCFSLGLKYFKLFALKCLNIFLIDQNTYSNCESRGRATWRRSKISKMKKPLALMSSLRTVAKSMAMERATLGRLHLLFSKLLRLRRR